MSSGLKRLPGQVIDRLGIIQVQPKARRLVALHPPLFPLGFGTPGMVVGFRGSLDVRPLYFSHAFRRRYFSRNSLRRRTIGGASS